MSGPVALFREIHRLRRFAQELKEQMDRLPRQLKAQQAKVTRQEEVFKEAQEVIKKLKVAVHEKEVLLRTTHNQIAKHQKQLNEATSKKEYDALQAEISSDRQKCLQLEDEILTGMGEGEEKTAQLPELEKAVRQAKDEYTRFEQGLGERQASLQQQHNDTLAQLKEVEAQVPDRIREQYNRIVNSKGADAMAAVRDRTCSACNSEITAQNYHDVQQQHFVVCKSCGRILYLPEITQA
jgi:predicted  nucleic acid-binding Zn-ribbon protein